MAQEEFRRQKTEFRMKMKIKNFYDHLSGSPGQAVG